MELEEEKAAGNAHFCVILCIFAGSPLFTHLGCYLSYQRGEWRSRCVGDGVVIAARLRDSTGSEEAVGGRVCLMLMAEEKAA